MTKGMEDWGCGFFGWQDQQSLRSQLHTFLCGLFWITWVSWLELGAGSDTAKMVRVVNSNLFLWQIRPHKYCTIWQITSSTALLIAFSPAFFCKQMHMARGRVSMTVEKQQDSFAFKLDVSQIICELLSTRAGQVLVIIVSEALTAHLYDHPLLSYGYIFPTASCTEAVLPSRKTDQSPRPLEAAGSVWVNWFAVIWFWFLG